jgi:hypothetical protein
MTKHAVRSNRLAIDAVAMQFADDAAFDPVAIVLVQTALRSVVSAQASA